MSSFIANAIIEHLRQGKELTEDDAKELNRFGTIDALRQCVREDDLPWIFAGMETSSDWVATVHLGLLHKFATHEEVRDRLRSAWEDGDTFARLQVMWRLLDDPELSEDWHQRIFALIQAEPVWFRDFVLKFHGSGELVLAQALRRLGDENFPQSKKWIYLCAVAAGSDNMDAARAVLVLAQSIDHPFTQQVARTLLAESHSRTLQ